MRPFSLLVAGRFHFVTLAGTAFCFLSFIPSSCDAFSERLATLHIGLAWPKDASPAKDAEFMFGTLIDKKVGFGIAADFLWNTRTHELDTEDINGNPSKITDEDESSYMFPVMGFFIVDPIPDQIIHPVAKFQIGYNSLIYNLSMSAIW